MARHPRVQVKGPERIPLQPQARTILTPVVRRRAEVRLGDLASALAPFAKGLGDLAGVLGQERSEKEVQKGIEAARQLLKEVGQDIQEATRRLRAGEIWSHESGWFLKGAREFFGRSAAANYLSTFQTWLSTSPVKNSHDPLEMLNAWRQYRGSYLERFGTNLDDDFRGGFDRAADGIDRQIAGVFGARADRNLRDDALQTVESLSVEAMKQLMRLPQVTRSGEFVPPPTVGDVGAGLNAMHDVQVKLGADRKESGEAMKRAVQRVAEQFKRLDWLDVLKHIRTQGENTLWTAARVDGTLQATQNRIHAAIEGRNRRARTDGAALRDQNTRVIMGEMITAIGENPGVDLGVYRQRLVAIGATDKADDLAEIRDRIVAERTSINKPDDVGDITESIFSDDPMGYDEVVDLVAERGLNKEDRDEVLALYDAVRNPDLTTFETQAATAINEQVAILKDVYTGVRRGRQQFSDTPSDKLRAAGVAANLFRIHARQMVEDLKDTPIPISELNLKLAQEANRIQLLVPEVLSDEQTGGFFGPQAWDQAGLDIREYHEFLDSWRLGGQKWSPQAEAYFIDRDLINPIEIYEFMEMPNMLEAARLEALKQGPKVEIRAPGDTTAVIAGQGRP